MSIFRVLNLRYLRRQPLRAFLATISIAGAIAAFVAGLIVVESIDKSLTEGVRGIAGSAPMRVTGPLTRGGVDPAVLERVEATEGVDQAVPVVTAVAVAQRIGGDPIYMVALGVDCRVESLVGTFGCEEQALDARTDGPVLVSPRLIRLAGKGADIRTDHGRVAIEGAVLNDSLDEANGGRLAVFDLATAQRLFDRGENFDSIYVTPQRGVSRDELSARLETSVGPTYAVLRGDEPALWMKLQGPLIPLLVLGIGIALGLSGLLVYNILQLSLADRRRDLAVASAVGTSPRLMIAGILGEAMVLGVGGGALGYVGGILAAQPMVGTFASVISTQATGIAMNVHVPVVAPVAAVLAGIVVGAGSAFVPARRALRLDLAGELHGRAVLAEDAPRRSLTRLALLLGGGLVTMGLSALAARDGALELWQPPLGALCLIASAFFMFAAVGAVAPMVLSALLGRMRNTGGALRLALANLVSRPRRTSVIATAVGAAVGTACVLGALIPATRATIVRSELVEKDAPISVNTLPLNNASNIDARPSEALAEQLELVRGVERVNRAYHQEISDDRGVYRVSTFEGVTRWSFERIAGEVGLAPLERGEAIVGTSLARVRNLRPGSTLQLATPTGFVPVRVSGIWVNSFDNGHNVTLGSRTYKRLFGAPAPHSLTVVGEDGVSSEELARRVRAARLDPDAEVRTSAQAAAALADEIGEQASPFWMLQRVLLVVALVGTLSTLLLVGVQRRRELGVLGAVGFTPLSIGRMTLTEALAAAGIGSFLGAIGSLAVFEVLRNASAVSIGVRTAYSVAPMSGVVATALALVVVACGAALPAWRAARLQIVEAIRDE